MKADRITLAIFGRFDDPLCNQLTHIVGTREVPKGTTRLIESGPHSEERLVVEEYVLDRNDIHFHLRGARARAACYLSVTGAHWPKFGVGDVSRCGLAKTLSDPNRPLFLFPWKFTL
jgi:hypothetical protein